MSNCRTEPVLLSQNLHQSFRVSTERAVLYFAFREAKCSAELLCHYSNMKFASGIYSQYVYHKCT